MSSFVATLNSEMNTNHINPEENVFESIWNEYERVILKSLVTSFGLDFIVHDQHGGDVDTIHNVRQIGDDSEMKYKNAANEKAYNDRGEYDSKVYHQDSRYKTINESISEMKENGELIDAYTGKRVARNAKIDLDHVVSAKEIHDDPGRVLAGLNGVDLANTEENLKPTNRSINRSKQTKDADEFQAYLEERESERKERIADLRAKKSLTDKERKELEKLENLDSVNSDKMREEYEESKKGIDSKIDKAYYTSVDFYKDTAAAAGKRGVEMGMRQALGFVFIEIYMGAELELKSMPSNSSLEEMLTAVGTGVKKGSENALEKYKDALEQFGEGFTSGALASITTTVCNIFFTTSKNLVRYIRQIYASVVQAGKVLLFNPNNLMFGDRIKTTTVIMATGASVLVGTSVGDLIAKTPVGEIPQVGQSVQTFSSTLVSGLLSCTLLVFLDRSQFMNDLITRLNDIPTEANNYKEVADAFEQLAVKLENLDLNEFRADTQKYQAISEKISNSDSEEEINELLLSAYKSFDIRIPWTGDFDDFMGNKQNRLVFE